MYEHCLKISELIAEDKVEEAKKYCEEQVESGVEDGSADYESLKSSAIEETEVWGDESEYWVDILSPAAELNNDEWKFVVGNFLLSVVKEFHGDGDLHKESRICKSAQEILSEIDMADRHENLALALYHHKQGHVSRLQDEYENAVDHFETALDIVEMSDGLGGWHYHALILRDLGRAKSDSLVSAGQNLKALDVLDEFSTRISDTKASTTEDYIEYLQAEEHKVRADMADTIGNMERKQEHLNRYNSIRNKSQEAT